MREHRHPLPLAKVVQHITNGNTSIHAFKITPSLPSTDTRIQNLIAASKMQILSIIPHPSILSYPRTHEYFS